MDGQTPKRTGNAHPNIYPYDSFPTATVPLFLAVGNDRQFRLLCQHLKVPNFAADCRYAQAGGRSQHRIELRHELEGLLASHDAGQLAEELMQLGVPCAPIFTADQALQHPHTEHREMVVRIGDNYTGIASPIKLSRTPATYRRPPPTILGNLD